MASSKEQPELPILARWRADMDNAMKVADLNDRKLAEKIGASQPMVWNIHKDPTTKTSTLVMPISEALGIAPPEFRDLLDEEQIEWSQLGHRLAALDRAAFDAFLRLVKEHVKGKEPPARVARPVGRATVEPPSKRQKPERAGDETPAEAAQRKRKG